MTITDEIALSLNEAGIMRRYHTMRLEEVEGTGPGALRWLRAHAVEVRSGCASIAFEGVGLTDTIIMMARGLHINGTSCRIVPLVRMSKAVKDADFRDAIREIDTLVILNAQDKSRPCPLHPSVAAEVEYIVRSRYDRGQNTWMQFEARGPLAQNDYWSGEFWDLTQRWDTLDASTLKGFQ